jgi:membrane protease YdiL (CAAX protease family)
VSVNAVKAVALVQPVANIVPLSLANPSRKVTPSVAVKSSVLTLSAPLAAVVPITRSEKAAAVVRDEVANWGVARHPDDSVLAPSLSRSFTSLSPISAPAAAPETLGNVPVPQAQAPAPGRPRLSKALLVSGAALVGVSLAAAAFPALVPAALSAWTGAFSWTGLTAMAASRFWRTPGAAPDVPRGPPAPAGGAFSSFKAAWAAARDSAAAQASFETRVGGSSWSSLRDWFLGGLRTGLYWMGPALLLMLAGAAAAKGVILAFGVKAAALAAAAASGGTIAFVGDTIPMTFVLGTLLPTALAAQAAGVALYFGVEALARKLGAGKAAPWLGGIAALALAAVAVLTLTHAPFIVAATLGLEAGVIWSAARSRSFVAPLALRTILTLFSIEAARLSIWLGGTAAGALIGLPAVWGGVAVAGLVGLALFLKAPGLRIAEIGAWWNASEPGQKPKSPARVLSAGLLWGLVVYAVGDLTFWAVNWLAPGAEPAPAILAKMLTSSVDLVLYNFVIVGLLEEYIFRRGLFKMMNDKLDKWGLSLGKSFWIAAIGSALIFSGVHYIDWGAMMGWFGMGDATAASGLGGAYAFTWAGFVARSALGVLLAWMYKRSGLLMIPIVAHFWADSMEGLGLRWGMPGFLVLAAGALILSFFYRPKTTPTPKSS